MQIPHTCREKTQFAVGQAVEVAYRVVPRVEGIPEGTGPGWEFKASIAMAPQKPDKQR
ncbi:MAG: hypothetical protein ACYC4H_11180 [Desulfocucumaceae bacterium]